MTMDSNLGTKTSISWRSIRAAQKLMKQGIFGKGLSLKNSKLNFVTHFMEVFFGFLV